MLMDGTSGDGVYLSRLMCFHFDVFLCKFYTKDKYEKTENVAKTLKTPRTTLCIPRS